MRAAVIFVLIFVHVIFITALKCKSEGGPKEEELKSIYTSCARRQEGQNMTEINGRSSWNTDGGRRVNERGWSRDESDTGMGFNDNGQEQRGYERDNSRYDNYNQNYQRNQGRRFRRDKRTEKNSGHRSQYNPNTSKNSDYEDSKKQTTNSSDTRDGSKACILHCFLEELEMTGDNGIPDRYLVTNVLTKNVKNEELRDFLQESIEECFQILYNEKSQDKCEFSKNLMMCLSEKGRANCDDWKDDIRF